MPAASAPHPLTLAVALALASCAWSPLASAQAQPAQAQQDAAHHDDHDDHDEAGTLDTVVVQSTRSRRRVSDDPIRVDVISREEIEEKILMTPGNISTLVAETAGVRVQSTAPAMGASSIRIQGLRGRYTQMLADGLPLHGGQASSIGLLQIPPTDLGRVEIIKGSASALYGPSALGGVVNLVSRRPGDTTESELLLNLTSRAGRDATAYFAAPLARGWGLSLTGGAHAQPRRDLDADGWADMPGHERYTLRPRLFWKADNGANALLTFGAMKEQRSGGTLAGARMPDGEPFVLGQDSTRHDAGAVIELPARDTDSLQLRASLTDTTHQHRFGGQRDDDRHRTTFVEAAYASAFGDTTWLAGAALQNDRFASRAFPRLDYHYRVPGVFVQAEHTLAKDLIVAASARWDRHSEFGAHLSPRLSLLYRPGRWTMRTSIGRGFHAPTPLVEEIEAAGLARLDPLAGLVAERATTASFDLGFAEGPWETNLALFASDIDHAVRLTEAPAGADGSARVRLVNVDGLTRTRGAELLARYRWRDFVLTGSYVFMDASEPDAAGGGRKPVPMTPRHTAGMVAMWEKHGRGRVGLEAYYTGRQSLDGNPYRSHGRAYVELGALGEITLGRTSVFLNLENILDVRQSRHDRLTLPRRAADGGWTVDAWAPTDGFVVNGGVRLKF